VLSGRERSLSERVTKDRARGSPGGIPEESMSVRASLSSWFLSGVAIAAVAVAAAPAAMLAQHTKAANPPRIAAIAPPPPTQSTAGSGRSFRSGRMSFSDNFPIAVLSDGRVFANFGRGFEAVTRACGSTDAFGGREGRDRVIPGTYPVQPVVVQPSVSQPTVGVSPPLPFTPPVPNQQTASQQMIQQITQPAQTTERRSGAESCWAVGPGGRMFIGQP
jgi:hypothetical protein